MVTIVDYNACNLRSVCRMLSYLNYEWEIASLPGQIAKATKLILPGVGHFDFAMFSLRQKGLIEVIKDAVVKQGRPTLGICLGAQLLTRRSAEGSSEGLGLVPADTVAFDRSRLSSVNRVPHMGWAMTEPKTSCRLFSGAPFPLRFYYVHSFHFSCDSPQDVICEAVHGYRFTAGFECGNIVGVQFHPEKSHRYGMAVLRNFVERY